MEWMGSLGIYVSVPFCKAKCTFCNFASDAFPPERMEGYVARLCQEMAAAPAFAQRHGLLLPPQVDTLFFGGGTPSLLTPGQFSSIFGALRSVFRIAPDAEITVEAAPGQIADDLLKELLAQGVNRISLGVQSFVDAETRAVGRLHTAAQCLDEIARLRSRGVRNVNVDLIAGMPHQTHLSLQHTLGAAIDAGVDHVSVYMLEVDEDSRLGRELIGPGVRYSAHAVPGDDVVAELYSMAVQTLGSAGLQQYEISNFARPGFESRHNLKYWTREPYLGFGLDAHSMLHAQNGCDGRFANASDLESYLSSMPEPDVDQIDALGRFEETVFLGLRLIQGLDISQLRRNHSSAWVDALLGRAHVLQRAGMMCCEKDILRLTNEGRIVSSAVFGELLATELECEAVPA